MSLKRKISNVLALRVERRFVLFAIATAFVGGMAAGVQNVQAERLAAAKNAQSILMAAVRR